MQYTLEERVVMGRYGTENGQAKAARWQAAMRQQGLHMVAEKATLQLLIARSLFAYCISYSHGP